MAWELAHNWESETGEPPPGPTVTIEDAKQLMEGLLAKAAGPPSCFTLRSPAGERLWLCLGGTWGCVSRLWREGPTRSFRVAKPSEALAPEGVLFQDGREGCYFQPPDLLPACEVIDAALRFFETGSLSPRLTWVGWDD